jgi:LysM repeat protein
MHTTQTFHRSLTVVISLLLVFAMLLAAAPQTALAAKCVSYHTVKTGEKAGDIAHTYGLPWLTIARANGMAKGEKPTAGDSLCIPAAKSALVAARNTGKLTLSSASGIVRVYASGFKAGDLYLVKFQNATGGPEYNVGRMRIEKGTSTNAAFNIPNDLRSAKQIEVCLKNLYTNKHTCKLVVVR